jgi:GH15 family glucan-1,4-alpha-glucosidase
LYDNGWSLLIFIIFGYLDELFYYDGWVYGGMLRMKGAGAWPLLNFWMTIYYALQGNIEKAQEYFRWVLERVEKYIPEQLFDNALQISVSPLAWSHAMFLIAVSFLEPLT